MHDKASATSSAASYLASGSAIGFGLSANEIGAIIGATVAIGTFFINWWYRHAEYKLKLAAVKSDDQGK